MKKIILWLRLEYFKSRAENSSRIYSVISGFYLDFQTNNKSQKTTFLGFQLN